MLKYNFNIGVCFAIKEWFREILAELSNDECCLFEVVAWAIWNSRNEMIHNRVVQNIEDTVEFVRLYLQKYQAVNEQIVETVQPANPNL